MQEPFNEVTELARVVEATLRLDGEWRVVQFDAAAADLLQRPPKEIVGASISTLLPGMPSRTLAEQALENPGLLRRAIDVRGQSRTLDVVACRAQDGTIVVNLRESSFETLAARVRELASRVDLAASAAELGFWEWDIQNDRLDWDGSRYRAGPGTRERGAPLEAAFFDLVHTEDRERIRGAIHDAIHRDVRYDVTFRFVQPGGTVRWVRAQGVVDRNDLGQAVRFTGVSHDITERVQAEERRASMQLEAQLRADTMAVLSDDLRQPLETMTSALQLMEGAPDPAAGKRARRVIVHQLRHLSRLVSALHDMAAIQGGALEGRSKRNRPKG